MEFDCSWDAGMCYSRESSKFPDMIPNGEKNDYINNNELSNKNQGKLGLNTTIFVKLQSGKIYKMTKKRTTQVVRQYNSELDNWDDGPPLAFWI